MNDQKNPRDWHVLCELASKEKDPEKLMELVKKLNQALDEKFKEAVSKKCEAV
jgi:spore coat protein CotH